MTSRKSLQTISVLIAGLAVTLGISTFTMSAAHASPIKPRLVHPLTGQAPENTYVVTKTSDSGDNNNPGSGTLRKALVDANNHAGFDAIVFDIPGSGVQTIKVKNYFPDITDNAGVMIDARQSDDRIEIDGSGISNHHGLVINSDNNVIKGLIINGVNDGGAGIALMGGASNNTIIGNYLGTNAAGNSAKGNHSGIYVSPNANNNFIGGPNGVSLGGACTGDCNLLSGNRFHGLVIDHASNIVVRGNYIGTNASGTGSVPNADDGILLAFAPNNTIGGSNPQDRNVISGNNNPNIEVAEADSKNNTIRGNYIGTNSAGTAKLSNGDVGILVGLGAHDNTIDANVISGNPNFGILVFKNATRTTITNNRVGMAANSDANIGNGLSGIEIQGNNNSLLDNRVAFSIKDGIRIKSGSNNPMRRNRTFSNGNFGQNLGTDAYTGNDSGDGDGGANGLQNFPTLSSAQNDGSTLTVGGTLNSRANARFEIEFFWNPACDSVFGHSVGEGNEYLGMTAVTTNGSGNASFSIPFGGGPNSGVITATATDSSNNTSELSICRGVTSGSPDPAPFQLLSPSNGESVGSNPPTLDWTDSANATYYKVTVRQDAKKGPKVYTNTNVQGSSVTINTLQTGHTYFWQVNACNANKCVKSSKFSFSVQ